MGFGHELGARHGLAHEADALGFAPIDEVAREEVVLRARHPAKQRPDHGRMVAGGDAEAGVAIGQPRLFGDERDVGHERDREPGAHGDAVDGGDDDLLAAEDGVDDLLGLLHEGCERVEAGLAGERGAGLDVGEVAARAERLVAGAGDDGDADVGVAVDVGPDAGEVAVEDVVRGVEDVGPVDGDGRDAVGDVDEEMAVAAVVHGAPPVRWAHSGASGGPRQPVGRGSCHSSPWAFTVMWVTHFTQSKPRWPGTTRRAGKPWESDNGWPATCSARSADCASAIEKRRL